MLKHSQPKRSSGKHDIKPIIKLPHPLKKKAQQQKTDAGGPEKLNIFFSWPYTRTSQWHNLFTFYLTPNDDTNNYFWPFGQLERVQYHLFIIVCYITLKVYA
jgi:hypothetical protein